MSRTKMVCLMAAAIALTSASFRAGAGEDEAGETPEQMKMKARTTMPAAADMDAAVTLDAMLAKKTPDGLSSAKGATVEGHVMQVEREEDGDYHIVLAAKAGETDTNKWVIVEVPKAWQEKSPDAMGGKALRSLRGKHVRATGWLYWEPETEGPDPRGTRWELHPVTKIEVL
ncbi:MAG TPA: hypothetical protein VFL14_15390 [Xanthomonadales bacterium]|nr:hypothetical protein [Xanthomonadales bacterium]